MSFERGDIILYFMGNPNTAVSHWAGRIGIVNNAVVEFDRVEIKFKEDMINWKCDINNLIKIGHTKLGVK